MSNRILLSRALALTRDHSLTLATTSFAGPKAWLRKEKKHYFLFSLLFFLSFCFRGFQRVCRKRDSSGEVVRLGVWSLLVGTLCIHRSGFSDE